MGFHGDFLRFHVDFIGFLGPRKRFYNSIINFFLSNGKINYRTEKINYRTKMGNVGKMWENRIIEQQRSDKNYRTTKKVRSKFRYVFFRRYGIFRIRAESGSGGVRRYGIFRIRAESGSGGVRRYGILPYFVLLAPFYNSGTDCSFSSARSMSSCNDPADRSLDSS